MSTERIGQEAGTTVLEYLSRLPALSPEVEGTDPGQEILPTAMSPKRGPSRTRGVLTWERPLG
jgi:hypothetical protein